LLLLKARVFGRGLNHQKEVIVFMEEMVMLIGNFGFPVAVSIYLLVRLEGKLETLTESIHSLSEALLKS
jgi:hypothetical protein